MSTDHLSVRRDMVPQRPSLSVYTRQICPPSVVSRALCGEFLCAGQRDVLLIKQDILELCRFDEAACSWRQLATYPLFETVLCADKMAILVKRDTTFADIEVDEDDDASQDDSDNTSDSVGVFAATHLLLEAGWTGGDILVYVGDAGHLTYMAVLETSTTTLDVRPYDKSIGYRFVVLQRIKVADAGSLNFCQLGKLLAIDPAYRCLAIGALQDKVDLYQLTLPVHLRYQTPVQITGESRQLVLKEFIIWHLTYLYPHPLALYRVMLVAVGYLDVQKELIVQFLDATAISLNSPLIDFRRYRFVLQGLPSPLHVIALPFHPESFLLVTEEKIYHIRAYDIQNGNISPATVNLPDEKTGDAQQHDYEPPLMTAYCTANDPLIEYLYMCQGGGQLYRVKLDNETPMFTLVGTVTTQTTNMLFLGRGTVRSAEQNAEDSIDTMVDILACMSDFGDLEIIIVSEMGVHERVVPAPYLAPVVDCLSAQAKGSSHSVLYCSSGTGDTASINKVQYGSQVAVLSENGSMDYNSVIHMWALKRNRADESDVIVILSFAAETRIMFLDEGVFHDISNECALDVQSSTIYMCNLEHNYCIAQVHKTGLVISKMLLDAAAMSDAGICFGETVARWTTLPGYTVSLASCSNGNGILMAMSHETSYELCYVQCTGQEGNILITTMPLLSIPFLPSFLTSTMFGTRAWYVIGCHHPLSSIHIYTAELQTGIKEVTASNLPIIKTPNVPNACHIIGSSSLIGTCQLFIGCRDGCIIAMSLTVTGEADALLSRVEAFDTGLSPVTFVAGYSCFLVVSNETLWMVQGEGKQFSFSKLLDIQCSVGASFRIAGGENTYMVISEGQLRFVNIQEAGLSFNKSAFPGTPRHLLYDDLNHFLVVAARSNTQPHASILRLLSEDSLSEMQTRSLELAETLAKSLENPEDVTNEIVLRLVEWRVITKNHERRFLMVGTGVRGKDTQSFFAGRFLVFRMDHTKDLAVLQEDPWGQDKLFDHPVRAICQISNMDILIGVGSLVMHYSLSKKSKELVKVNEVSLSNTVTCIQETGSLIAVGTVHDSLNLFRYDEQERALHHVGADRYSRTINDIMIWNNSFVVSDRLGNLCGLTWDESSQEFMMSSLFQYRVGRQVLRLCKGRLKRGPRRLDILDNTPIEIGLDTKREGKDSIDDQAQSIFACSLLGSIDVISVVPSAHLELLHNLQRALMHHPLIQPTAYQEYRGLFYPVHSVIDGDLCSLFGTLQEKEKKPVVQLLNTFLAADRANAAGMILASSPTLSIQDVEAVLREMNETF